MIITQLDVYSLRIIKSLRLLPHARWNVVFGENGSGKTSFLEAIYLLSHGRSFRTRDTNALIKQDEDALMLFARTHTDHTVSIKKAKIGTIAMINEQSCLRRSELAQLIPCQVFYQDIFSVIDAGPTVRRSMLDWGLFHVKHEYMTLWKEYKRVLKQRNALLRQRAPHVHFRPWDVLLEELSEAIDDLRKNFCLDWSSVFNQTLTQLTSQQCSMNYEKGWDKKKTGKRLIDILDEQFPSDIAQQYTHSGAHQADISLITPSSLKAKQSLSRGQQKMILIALKISQAQLVSKQCVYLFDDILTELDLTHIDKFLSYIELINGQFFFTCTNLDHFASRLSKDCALYFEVSQGVFTQYVRD